VEDRLNLMHGFHRIERKERLSRISEFCGLSEEEAATLSGERPVSPDLAENFIENVVGFFPIPLGMATYFRIDGKDHFIPMAVEETSIVAAASSAAKWARDFGADVQTEIKGRLIIGQIQLPSVENVERAKKVLHESENELIALANACIPGLVQRGGGVQRLEVRELKRAEDPLPMLVLHLLCDPKDAMGANLINQVCEALKPRVEALTGEKVGLCILSNLVDSKLVKAKVTLKGLDESVAKGIEEATRFAKVDPYRAATHNKGILNGIDAVLLATGNDWRAVEAGVHAFAARSGQYQPVSDWRAEGTTLTGQIEIPLALGTVGGVTRLHPIARIALKVLGVQSAEDLARICVSVGLIQNLGALRALSTVGIVKGHMRLHAANLAIAAGAETHEIAEVRERLVESLKIDKRINLTQAQAILEEIRANPTEQPTTI
jgi:hydroxymethylglutaryl-CoA reductase